MEDRSIYFRSSGWGFHHSRAWITAVGGLGVLSIALATVSLYRDINRCCRFLYEVADRLVSPIICEVKRGKM